MYTYIYIYTRYIFVKTDDVYRTSLNDPLENPRNCRHLHNSDKKLTHGGNPALQFGHYRNLVLESVEGSDKPDYLTEARRYVLRSTLLCPASQSGRRSMSNSYIWTGWVFFSFLIFFLNS